MRAALRTLGFLLTAVAIGLTLVAAARAGCGGGDGKQSTIGGCGGGVGNVGRSHAAPDGGAAFPAIAAENGVQLVRVRVGSDGFRPQRVSVAAGHLVLMVFTRERDAGCVTAVQIPSLRIAPTPLAVGQETYLAFRPEKKGRYAFICSLGMVRGELLVR